MARNLLKAGHRVTIFDPSADNAKAMVAAGAKQAASLVELSAAMLSDEMPATRADLGPKLTGARMRELGRAKLRELVEDPTRANPDTVMPPFGRHRILEPAETTGIVEYLHALP